MIYRVALDALITFLLLAQSVTVPGTTVALEPPEGMTLATRFAGFESRSEEASILVVEMPAPLSEAVAGLWNPEKLATQRMTLLNAEKVNLVEGPADLLSYRQRFSGSEYAKWSLVTGDERRTVIVSATCDAALESKWRDPFRKSLLTLRRVALQPAKGTFQIEPRGGLQQTAHAMPDALTYTLGGEFPLKKPDAPLFIVSRSLAPAPVGSLEQFAERRARQLPGFQNLSVKDKHAVRIDGLEGIELTGLGDSQFLYEVVLRDPKGGYYLLVGTVSNTEEGHWLPLFRDMSATFLR